MNDPKSGDLSRRRVFAGAGTAGALAAAAIALPVVKPVTSADAAAKVEPPPDKGAGYQTTQHVLDYYRTARV